MKMFSLKRSLGYQWYQSLCFLLQLYSHFNHLKFIRSFDQSIDDHHHHHSSKDSILYLCLILFSLTMISSSISNLCHFISNCGNRIEEEENRENVSFDEIRSRYSLPLLTLFDLFIALIIFFPRLIIDVQWIRSDWKDSSKSSLSPSFDHRWRFSSIFVKISFFNLQLIF